MPYNAEPRNALERVKLNIQPDYSFTFFPYQKMIAENSSDLTYVIGDKAIVNPFYVNLSTQMLPMKSNYCEIDYPLLNYLSI